MSVMIWGAISWDYKSELVFIKKLLERKDIYSKIYLQEILEPVVFLLFDILGLEYIFMENSTKVYCRSIHLLRL
jgi:hypothetical protein